MELNIPLIAINPEYVEWDIGSIHPSLFESIKDNGILVPITCVLYNHEYYVVDGYQRFRIAEELELKAIPCVSIEPDISISDLIYQLHQFKLHQSVLLRLRYCDSFGFDITESVAKKMSFPYYSHIKTDIKRICSLDDSIQQFIYFKGYSLKEMVHLIHFSIDLVAFLISHDSFLSFSKRSFDQVIEQCSQLMKRHTWSLNECLDCIGFNSIIQSDHTPQQRLRLIMDGLHQQCNPTLIDQNNKLKSILHGLKQHVDASIEYDTSLEDVDIKVSTRFSTMADYNRFHQQLSSDVTIAKFKELMDQL